MAPRPEPDLPAQVSTAPGPVASPTPSHQHHASLHSRIKHRLDAFPTPSSLQVAEDGDEFPASPELPAIVSPAYTPPATPSIDGFSAVDTQDGERDQLAREEVARRQSHHATRPPRRSGVSSTKVPTLREPHPKLLDTLPVVTCIVRARIPTTTGQEMFLHLYQNNVDSKEHLAIVFGPHIRSQSLDAVRPGESEMDRMIRGAYTGRLYPGRTSSRAQEGSVGSKAMSSRQQHEQRQPAGEAIDEETTQSKSVGSASQAAMLAMSHDALPRSSDPPLVRVHSECYTGETVWSARCDCGEQLDEAARLMSLPVLPNSSASTSGAASPTGTAGSKPHVSSSTAGSDANAGPGGVIIYLRQEGRGIGLGEKLKAYNLQDLGSDTVEANLLLRHPADARSYGLATAMLVDLGLGGDKGIRLLTNNPDKISAVEGRNKEVKVVERVAMVPLSWSTGGEKGVNGPELGGYLRTKIEKMGHMMQM